MTSTLIHIIYGTIIALILKLDLIPFLVFTNLPDLDGIVDIFKDNIKYHRCVLHNIFAYFLILIIGSIFFSFKLVFTALTLHFFLDAFKGENSYLYPFSKKKFVLYPSKKKYPFWVYIFYDENIYFTIISLILFFIFLLFY